MPVSLTKSNEGSYALNVQGYTCPYPVLFTVRALKQIAPGEILEVVLDNPPSCETVPAAAEKQGCKVLEVSRISDKLWRIRIRK